jgi:predicted Zn-dependent protease
MEVLDEATVNNLDISYEWLHGNNNLELEIQSSLESKWQEFLDVSIRDWNNSQALVLTSNQTAYESTCRLEVGKLKICNADYGTTDWRGITTVLLEGKQIIASAIKLNDFYTATDALNQYDVCHQLGHAFGLRHSEGNNCMASLTSWNRWTPPEHPDQSNLDELVELYKQDTRQRDLEFRHQLRGRSPEGVKEHHRVEVHKV